MQPGPWAGQVRVRRMAKLPFSIGLGRVAGNRNIADRLATLDKCPFRPRTGYRRNAGRVSAPSGLQAAGVCSAPVCLTPVEHGGNQYRRTQDPFCKDSAAAGPRRPGEAVTIRRASGASGRHGQACALSAVMRRSNLTGAVHGKSRRRRHGILRLRLRDHRLGLRRLGIRAAPER